MCKETHFSRVSPNDRPYFVWLGWRRFERSCTATRAFMRADLNVRAGRCERSHRKGISGTPEAWREHSRGCNPRERYLLYNRNRGAVTGMLATAPRFYLFVGGTLVPWVMPIGATHGYVLATALRFFLVVCHEYEEKSRRKAKKDRGMFGGLPNSLYLCGV